MNGEKLRVFSLSIVIFLLLFC